MAALLFSAAGSAVGTALFGPIGGIAGRLIGALAGNVLDNSLFGIHTNRSVEGPRKSDLTVLASSEGAPIPRVYGRVRVGGQVIWATNLEEVVTTRSDTQSAGGKGGGGGSSVTTATTTYTYFANIAAGLCEGPVGRVNRVWADGKPLDLAGLTYRVYPGSESQTPDPLIVAKEGTGDVPAYRGLAYIVFERLPLENFGNRIPQLSFEIVRPIGQLETMVRAVTLIPGSIEFGYETATVVRVLGPGQNAPENRHVDTARSDVIASLDDLQAICPYLERVAIVVAWFGSDLRASLCKFKPGIDNREKSTSGATWSVAGVTRPDAYLVSLSGGHPAFGGTPSDDSVVHLIGELKARGIKVTLYPFAMMDIAAGNALTDPWTGSAPQPSYPWRGTITCDPAPGQPDSPDGTAAAADQVAGFFNGSGPSDWSYRRMILHYADLAESAGGVDAFLIGSEFKALTRVRSAPGVYPAVAELMTLAADVKAIVGPGTAVTYGADWTEYGAHVVDAGAQEIRFPLDPLWASSAIDCVGIDYYVPLSDWRDDASQADAAAVTIYNRDYLSANINGGEAYDWYYADDAARQAQTRTPITDGLGKQWIHRAKDLWSWWSNPHYERVGGVELGSPTPWPPRSKPIWLTEAGCPAVDKGANQPSVFPDPKSATGGYPYFSDGSRDDLIQRRYLETVLTAFDPSFGGALNPISPVYGGRMIDVSALHLWTWDARPYPVFPAALEVWSDGPNWSTGHWLTGRLGASPLADLVLKILADSGIVNADTAAVLDSADGYVIDRPMSPRAAIEPLTMAYAFDASEQSGQIVFRSRGGIPAIELGDDDLVVDGDAAAARLVRTQETELPRQVSLGFVDGGADYKSSAVTSRRLVGGSASAAHADVAVVTSDAAAQRRADIWLQDLWAGRERAEFALPPSRLALTPGDVAGLTLAGRRRLIQISTVVDTQSRAVTARSFDPDVFDVPLSPPRLQAPVLPPALGPVHAVVLDLPSIDAQPPPVLSRIAVFADPWPGPVAIFASSDGLSFSRTALALAPAIAGETLDAFPAGPSSRWDDASRVRVKLYGGALASLSDMRVLGGANAAAVQRADGAWEIVQFANAELVGVNTYALSRLLRGQAGSEWAIADPLPAGAPFVMLDEHVVPVARGLDSLGRPLQLRIVAAGHDTGDPSAVALTLTPTASALRPLSPVHLAARRMADGIHLSWIRRTRIDGDSWSAGEVPLGEDSEAYAVDILNGADTVRTLSALQPSIVYAGADELADFGAPQSILSVRVAQLSATIGRGVPAQSLLAL